MSFIDMSFIISIIDSMRRTTTLIVIIQNWTTL